MLYHITLIIPTLFRVFFPSVLVNIVCRAQGNTDRDRVSCQRADLGGRSNMKFVLITKDHELEAAAKQGFHPSDECITYSDWSLALENCEDADLLFVDLLATLTEPHKIAGYEAFALAKMNHERARQAKVVLISPDPSYELDFMAGWPDFVFLHYRRPVDYKIFRRASTWV